MSKLNAFATDLHDGEQALSESAMVLAGQVRRGVEAGTNDADEITTDAIEAYFAGETPDIPTPEPKISRRKFVFGGVLAAIGAATLPFAKNASKVLDFLVDDAEASDKKEKTLEELMKEDWLVGDVLTAGEESLEDNLKALNIQKDSTEYKEAFKLYHALYREFIKPLEQFLSKPALTLASVRNLTKIYKLYTEYYEAALPRDVTAQGYVFDQEDNLQRIQHPDFDTDPRMKANIKGVIGSNLLCESLLKKAQRKLINFGERGKRLWEKKVNMINTRNPELKFPSTFLGEANNKKIVTPTSY